MATVDDCYAVLLRIEKLLREKRVTDPATGLQTVFEADGSTPFAFGALFEDAAGTQPYRGQGAERAERLAYADEDTGGELDFSMPANSQYAALPSVGGL